MKTSLIDEKCEMETVSHDELRRNWEWIKKKPDASVEGKLPPLDKTQAPPECTCWFTYVFWTS